MAWPLLALLALGAAYEESGYLPALQLLNHRWDAACPLWEAALPSIPHAHPRALGPCPAEYQVIHLTPKSIPRFLLTARCAEDCLDQRCSNRGPFKCVELHRKVEIGILDYEADRPVLIPGPVPWTVSDGCICSTNPNVTLAYNTPPQLVT